MKDIEIGSLSKQVRSPTSFLKRLLKCKEWLGSNASGAILSCSGNGLRSFEFVATGAKIRPLSESQQDEVTYAIIIK
jgi:hypothetical protein